MTPADYSAAVSAIRDTPRDTTIVLEGNVKLANALHRQGFSVVLVGGECDATSVPGGQDLADGWSSLTGRSNDAVCIGSKPLCRLVEHLAVRAKINNNTARYRSRGWCEHLLGNFHHLLQPSFGAYTGTLRGVPAFVVGAGPSLDDDIEQIRKLSEYGLVIGVNAAARLVTHGMALTVEGNDLRFKLGSLGPETIRAFSLFAPPAVLEHGAGPLFPIYSGELATVPERLTAYKRLASCSIGGTAAVSLAERLGCDPIVLVGHDFCLRDGGRIYPECLGIGDSRAHLVDGEHDKLWHFDWATELQAQPRQNPMHSDDLAIPVKNAAGDTVYTTQALKGPGGWLEQVAERLKGRTRCYQASHGGAVLVGWESIELRVLLASMDKQEYSLSPAENGLSAGMLLHWLEKQMTATEALQKAARIDGSESSIGALRDALGRAALAEPWCHPKIAEIAEGRRAVPPSRNACAERDIARADARTVGRVIAEECDGLVMALCMTIERIRSICGTVLEEERAPAGAADDLLRATLRSMQPYQRLSPTGKALSWLTA